MTRVRDLVNRARRELLGSTREILNLLGEALDDSEIAVDLSLATTGLTTGSILEVDAEIMNVTAVSGGTVTVVRGWLGSTPNEHATGAVVKVNPVIFDASLMQGVNEELASLCSPLNGLMQVAYDDITLNSDVGFDLNTLENVQAVLDLRYTETLNDLVQLWDWDLVQLPSGMAHIRFPRTHRAPNGKTMRVWYGADFGQVSDLDEDVGEVAGAPDSITDLLWMGTAIRAWAGKEPKRSLMERQGDARRADEVPPGSLNAAPAAFRAKYEQRIAEEAARLLRAWPKMRRL